VLEGVSIYNVPAKKMSGFSSDDAAPSTAAFMKQALMKSAEYRKNTEMMREKHDDFVKEFGEESVNAFIESHQRHISETSGENMNPAAAAVEIETDMDRLVALKEEANAAYKEKDFGTAVKRYGAAIKFAASCAETDSQEFQRQRAIIHANRAAANLGLKKYVGALVDAQRASELNPDYWKGPFRAGSALMKMAPRLERSEMAVKYFEKCYACSSLPSAQKKNISRALELARYRLEKGRDEVPLPENCVVQ